MRKAPESERARMWREFYAKTDPNNITPENEALNQYFGRIAQANQRFTDEGVPGWRTDRGEVFVNLGPPDEAVENSPGTTANRIVRWSYINYRLELFFRDEDVDVRTRRRTQPRAARLRRRRRDAAPHNGGRNVCTQYHNSGADLVHRRRDRAC